MCNYCYMKGFLQDLSTLAARVQTDVLSFTSAFGFPQIWHLLSLSLRFQMSQLLPPAPPHVSLSAFLSFSHYTH